MRRIVLDHTVARALVHGDNDSAVVTAPPVVDPPWLEGEHVLIGDGRYVIRRLLASGLLVESMGILSTHRRRRGA